MLCTKTHIYDTKIPVFIDSCNKLNCQICVKVIKTLCEFRVARPSWCKMSVFGVELVQNSQNNHVKFISIYGKTQIIRWNKYTNKLIWLEKFILTLLTVYVKHFAAFIWFLSYWYNQANLRSYFSLNHYKTVNLKKYI